MKKPTKTPAPRNTIVVAMNARHHGYTVMKDRRASRGGTRNKQVEYRNENF